jgi:hypothetical protein
MRRTYHYDEKFGRMVEGPAPRKESSGDGYLFSDRLYSDNPFVAHDGTLIGSRKQHREYMKRHSLTTMDDFKQTWKDAAKQREQVFTGTHDKRERREQVARAMEKIHG